MKHTGLSEWEMLLAILKDYRPHRNFDIPGEIKGRFYDQSDALGMFPVAARIRTLREKKYQIKAGPPYEFNRETIRQKDHYYQLEREYVSAKPEPKPKFKDLDAYEEAERIREKVTEVISRKPQSKQLTIEFMKKNSRELKEILA